MLHTSFLYWYVIVWQKSISREYVELNDAVIDIEVVINNLSLSVEFCQ